MTDRDGFARSVNITVRAKTPELIDDAIEQTRQVLRRERGLKPGEEDNFDFFNSAEPDHAVQPDEHGRQDRAPSSSASSRWSWPASAS